MKLLKSTLEHEGFRSKPYQDTLGIWTIGHGLTYITRSESRVIVEGRLKALSIRWGVRRPWLIDHPPELRDVITEMSFQMGFKGVLKFKKMWKALSVADYALAADEMLDSKWATQTPERALEMSEIVRAIAQGIASNGAT